MNCPSDCDQLFIHIVLQLDPSRADQAQIEGNSRQLQVLAEQILDAIRESIDVIPL